MPLPIRFSIRMEVLPLRPVWVRCWLAAASSKNASSAELYWFPTVSTDKPDYPPGTPVEMTAPVFNHLRRSTFIYTSGSTSPLTTIPMPRSPPMPLAISPMTDMRRTPAIIGARYHLTAVGMSSGYQAQTIFTDGIVGVNFTNAPLDQAVGACGQLVITVNTDNGIYGTIYLSDTTGTGSFYASSGNCTGATNPITQINAIATNNVWYRNSAASSPELTACTISGGLNLCELEQALFGGVYLANQNESIYSSATQLVFTAQPGGGAPGAAWLQQPVVAVQDVNHNTVANNSDSITLTISTGGGALNCVSNPLNASSGFASYSGCSISGVASSSSCYRLTATDSTLNFSTTSNCFYITNAASPTNSTVTANPTTVVNNGTATSTITVTLKDSGGNLLPNKLVTLVAGSGSSGISAGSNGGISNVNGVVTFTVSDSTAQVVTYTAIDTTDGVTVTQTATVTFAPGTVSNNRSSVTASPTSVAADGVTISTITVTLEDSSSDVVPGETVTLTGNGGTNSVISVISGVTNSNGVATFTVTDTHVENVTYTAAYSGANGTGTISGANPTVRFTSIGTTLNLSVNPNAITFGSSPVVLTAALSVTSGGTGVTGVLVSFYRGTFSCSAGSTLLGSVITDTTGTATFNYVTTALATGSYQICAFTSTVTINNLTYGSASSGSQNLIVGNATTLTWTTPPPASAIYNTTFSPVAHGSSSCTVSYAVTGGCSLANPNHITMTSGTTACQVTANLAACRSGGTYYGPQTLSSTVNAQLATPTALVLTGVPLSAGDGVTFTVGTTGGSVPDDTGAVTIIVSGNCSVVGNQVTMSASTGSCLVHAVKASDGDYAAVTSATSTVTAAIGIETVTISNTSQTYTGSPLPVTVTTTPVPGVSVDVEYTGINGTVYAQSSTAPTQVGTYSVTATITDSNYAGSATATEYVTQLAAGLSLAIRTGTTNPSPYGTMASFDLTVSVSNGSCPTGNVQLTVDGTNVGTPQAAECATKITFSTATIEPGVNHQIAVQYSGDVNHSQGTSNTVLFTVSADTTSVTLAASAGTIDVGQPVTFTATVSPASLDPSANGPAGTVDFYVDGVVQDTETLSGTSPYTAIFTTSSLTAGSHNIYATYVPGTDAEFGGSSSTITVTTVDLIAPTITWPAPANIVYGTPLSDIQLNATATDPINGNITVPGTFAYTPVSGTVLATGTTNLNVTFTPTDPTTYSTNTAQVTITVDQATLTVTADPQTMVFGGPIPTLTYTFSGFANGDVPSQVTGTASCTTTATLTSAVSPPTYPINCTQGTLAEKDYTFTFVAGQLTVTIATPTFTLLCPEVTYDGNPHSCVGGAVGVDGKTVVAGTWVYNPASETDTGSYPETGTFTSTDTNYLGGSATGTLIIDQASSSVTLTCPSSVPYNGAAQTPCTASVTGAGGLTQSLTSAIAYTNNTAIGTATASASYAGDTNHKASSNTVTFAISGAAIVATAGSYNAPYDALTHTIPACVVSGTYTGTLTCTNNPVSVGPGIGGPAAVTPTIVGDTTGFTVILTNGSWSITKATPTVTAWPTAGAINFGQTLTASTLTGGTATFNGNPVAGTFAWTTPTQLHPCGYVFGERDLYAHRYDRLQHGNRLLSRLW